MSQRLHDRTSCPSGWEVRSHYLNLAKQLHPDRFNSAPEEVKRVVTRQFQNLNAAYEVLKRHFQVAA